MSKKRHRIDQCAEDIRALAREITLLAERIRAQNETEEAQR